MKSITNLFNLLTLSCFLLMFSSTSAQISINGKNCIGVWKTIDDETGRTKSHVEIFKKGSKIHAKVIKLLDPKTLTDNNVKRFEDVICTKCPVGHGKDEHLIGLEMIWDMYESSDKWKGGSILDPKNGKVYTCTMWMDDSDSKGNTLMVRGWVAFFYRTQTWHRIK